MKNDADQKFLSTLRSSLIGEKIVEDAENHRLQRRRAALEKLAAFRETEAEWSDKLRVGQAEIDDRRLAYEAADAALREAGAALYMAEQKVDTLRVDWQRDEGAAYRAVGRETNPRIRELLWEPIRVAIEKTRAAPLETQTKADMQKIGYPPKEFHSSRPSMFARVAFLEHASKCAGQFLLLVDDSDDTLTRIRDAILSAAPSAERLVSIPLDRDGGRLTVDQETAGAVAAANELADRRFGLVLQETKNG